ncbi:hypothetical protein C7T94_17750 [Pedobacter yulinensis]|uniref:DUF2931 domain-containing protein n=1 Tax=Pedobacter yulinensis TaxID=2126353 RepID=A0A2T3HGZ7_9SPHI|nr:DUF2931 family protein [Pedobacter yulinensis]PST81718.1 hypothetical protein C7T94_17750 [Pedobacter yulinensis]
MRSGFSGQSDGRPPVTSQSRANQSPQFFWEEGINCPVGYPIRMISGEMELEDGSTYILSTGFCSGLEGWGGRGSGMFAGMRPLPRRLAVTWLSFAEERCYHLSCGISADVMKMHFEGGFQAGGSEINGRRETYDMVNIGLAPGGLVVVWLAGAGRQIEVAYQHALPCTVRAADIGQLDASQRLIFDRTEIRRIMNDPLIVPGADGRNRRPGALARWEHYRKRHCWHPWLLLPAGCTLEGLAILFFNGEQIEWFGTDWPDKGELLPIPQILSCSWRCRDDRRYGITLRFNESEIFSVFSSSDMHKTACPALRIRTNLIMTVAVTELETRDKWVLLKRSYASIHQLT